MAKEKVDTFPKVVFDSNIAKIVVDDKGTQIVFKELSLTGNQIELLAGWLDDKESHTRVTIEQMQGSLEFED